MVAKMRKKNDGNMKIYHQNEERNCYNHPMKCGFSKLMKHNLPCWKIVRFSHPPGNEIGTGLDSHHIASLTNQKSQSKISV